MNKIVKISLIHMYESCVRHTFYVIAETDEGYTKSVSSHRTGSLHPFVEGLTLDEARDRALIDAADWGDFLQLEVTPFEMDYRIWEPSMRFDIYKTRRELDERP